MDQYYKYVLKSLNLSQEEMAQLSVSTEERETLYASGYALYGAGNYSRAAAFFTRLVLSFPQEERLWRGLAAARQMEEKYEEALHAWGVTALLCSSDPLPHFHAAECLLASGEKKEALKALGCAQALLQVEDMGLKNKIELLSSQYG